VHDTLLRGPVEPGQYTSYDYAQVLDDHHVLASVGTVGDWFDNALAESFVDSFKTELIADRVWRAHVQLELAVVDYVGWFTAGFTPRSGTDPPWSTNANTGRGSRSGSKRSRLRPPQQ
jgi:transposase InsO family protein